ncbi:MAG: hypothetical protein AAGF04_01910 [Chlamydiota bacterium]
MNSLSAVKSLLCRIADDTFGFSPFKNSAGQKTTSIPNKPCIQSPSQWFVRFSGTAVAKDICLRAEDNLRPDTPLWGTSHTIQSAGDSSVRMPAYPIHCSLYLDGSCLQTMVTHPVRGICEVDTKEVFFLWTLKALCELYLQGSSSENRAGKRKHRTFEEHTSSGKKQRRAAEKKPEEAVGAQEAPLLISSAQIAKYLRRDPFFAILCHRLSMTTFDFPNISSDKTEEIFFIIHCCFTLSVKIEKVQKVLRSLLEQYMVGVKVTHFYPFSMDIDAQRFLIAGKGRDKIVQLSSPRDSMLSCRLNGLDGDFFRRHLETHFSHKAFLTNVQHFFCATVIRVHSAGQVKKSRWIAVENVLRRLVGRLSPPCVLDTHSFLPKEWGIYFVRRLPAPQKASCTL